MANQNDSAPSPVNAILPKGDVNRTTPTTTYNPRERSFIKAPEVKICPHCGQTMAPDVQPIRNVMSPYVNAQGVAVVMNDDADTVNMKGVTFGRVTSYTKDGKPQSSFLTPATPEKK